MICQLTALSGLKYVHSSPSLVPAGLVQDISLERLENPAHASLDRLSVGQDVAALLRVNTRDAIPKRVSPSQQAASK